MCGGGSSNSIEIGDNTRLVGCKFIFRGEGNKIVLGENSFFQGIEFYIEDNNNEISTGRHCLFCGQAHLACCEGTSITFGNDVLMSSEIVFRTTDSHSIVDMSRNRINHAKSISVGNHVWIGNRAVVLKGSILHENTVVASAAVVAGKEYKSGTVIAGNPASVVKEDINWEFERI